MLHARLIELEKQFKFSPLTQLFSSLLEQNQVELWIKRDDLIHPVISGNKWRKLKYTLDHALKINAHTFVSMGGTYSNHLHALAFIGKQLGIKTVAYIRGEQAKVLNPTLQDIQNWGMELRFISRSDYRLLRQYKGHDKLPDRFSVDLQEGYYWLPEGGATTLALKGVGEIIFEIEKELDFDILAVPCGTGTTLAGLIETETKNSFFLGFSALKGAGFLINDVNNLLTNKRKSTTHWDIQLDYHFGGFAKRNDDLLLFIKGFENEHQIELEPVYSGKMFFGLFDLIEQGFFKPGQKIVAIHTGGLQGNR